MDDELRRLERELSHDPSDFVLRQTLAQRLRGQGDFAKANSIMLAEKHLELPDQVPHPLPQSLDNNTRVVELGRLHVVLEDTYGPNDFHAWQYEIGISGDDWQHQLFDNIHADVTLARQLTQASAYHLRISHWQSNTRLAPQYTQHCTLYKRDQYETARKLMHYFSTHLVVPTDEP